MHKNILLAIGISGVLIGCSGQNRPSEEKVQISKEACTAVVESPLPKFIYLQNQGLSESKEA